MIKKSALLLTTACTLFLTACASSDTRYPSLAVRDFERAQGQFEPAEKQQLDVPEIKTDFEGDLATHLANLLDQAQAAHGRFEASTPNAQSTVMAARGSSVESNAWEAAQIAVADLDSHRSQAAIVLAELDTLFAAASIQYEDNAQIAQTRSQVAALVLQEDAVLNGLRRALR